MATKPVYRFVAVFVDAEGEEAEVSAFFPVTDGDTTDGVSTVLGEWADVLATMTNARLKRQSFTLETYRSVSLPAIPSNQPYVNIEDKLLLVLQSNITGTTFLNKIPAPKIVNFLADQETYNPNSIPIANYKNIMEHSFVTNQGGSGLFLTKGYLMRMKTRRTLRQGIPSERGG